MDEIVKTIADAMNNSLGASLTVFLLSMIPIAEARFAIPFGISMGLTPIQSFGWAFLGTSIVTPILLLVLIPIIKALAKTKLFSKLGKFLFDKFEKKSRSLNENNVANSNTNSPTAKKHYLTKSDLKRMGGTAAFVAIPVPLTGVWTGCAVASIINLGFVKGLISIILGNAVACSIITLICYLFAPYVNYITIGFAVIAILVVVALIVKLVLFKPSDSNAEQKDNTDKKDDNGTTANDMDGNSANVDNAVMEVNNNTTAKLDDDIAHNNIDTTKNNDD